MRSGIARRIAILFLAGIALTVPLTAQTAAAGGSPRGGFAWFDLWERVEAWVAQVSGGAWTLAFDNNRGTLDPDGQPATPPPAPNAVPPPPPPPPDGSAEPTPSPWPTASTH